MLLAASLVELEALQTPRPDLALGQRSVATTEVPKIADQIFCIAEVGSCVPTTALSRCNKVRIHGNYSITSSALARSVGGTVRPCAFAVVVLITNSYLVGACTGRSAGFSPLRMRSMYAAARRILIDYIGAMGNETAADPKAFRVNCRQLETGCKCDDRLP